MDTLAGNICPPKTLPVLCLMRGCGACAGQGGFAASGKNDRHEPQHNDQEVEVRKAMEEEFRNLIRVCVHVFRKAKAHLELMEAVGNIQSKVNSVAVLEFKMQGILRTLGL